MAGAPTPDPFSDRQLQAISRIVSQRVAESVRLGRSEYPRNLRLAKTVSVDDEYPVDGDTFAIRFVDAAFSPMEAGVTTLHSLERTAEGDEDGAADVIAREINSRYVPEGSYVSALWQRGLAGDTAEYGEWWIRWPTGPDPEPDPCACTLITTSHCASTVSRWDFTVAGLTNSDCSDCDTWNGDFELCYVSDNLWETEAYDGTECGHVAGDPLWTLERKGPVAGEYYELTANGLGYTWRKYAQSGSLPTGTWYCLANNTLALQPAPVPAPCSGVPATITVVPCVTACGFCTGGVMPDPVSVTFTGFGADLKCDCNPLNATFSLAAYAACFWRVTGTFDCSTPGQWYEYEIVARLIYQTAGTVMLQVALMVTCRKALGVCGIQQFTFRDTLASPLDCSATRAVPLYYLFPNPPQLCSGAPTCQFN